MDDLWRIESSGDGTFYIHANSMYEALKKWHDTVLKDVPDRGVWYLSDSYMQPGSIEYVANSKQIVL